MRKSTVAAVTAGAALLLPIAALPAGAQPPLRVDLLDQPMNGRAAVEALGEHLPAVAARNRTSPRELVELLEADDAFWLDPEGQLLVKDEHLPRSPASTSNEPAPLPNEQTFTLHSNPGSARVIYLDFDGHAVSGTAWNTYFGVSDDSQPPLDLDGRPSTWSQAEHDLIQDVFRRVAEDFAPFDVDVTTEDPGTAAIERLNSADEQFGTRVLVTPSRQAHDAICGGCGGVAFVGIYNRPGNTFYHPAWVFSHMLLNNAKYIAEAVSHEAGHNLGLWHDGTPASGYYGGHHNWAPIMGVGYYQPLVQWSRGEYPRANNMQDDVAVIGEYGLPQRLDDHPSTTRSARFLGVSGSISGVIESREDRDVFFVPLTCTGPVTIQARTASRSPNLDTRVRLLDLSGAVIAEDDPVAGRSTYDVASGLSATATVEITRQGLYYIEIDGVGALDTSLGYSDYGSLGAYEILVTDTCTRGAAG